MSITPQSEQREAKKSSNRGTEIVIYGGLAAIFLWLTVLVSGRSIMSLGSIEMSLFYAVLVSVPTVGVATAALRKLSMEATAKK